MAQGKIPLTAKEKKARNEEILKYVFLGLFLAVSIGSVILVAKYVKMAQMFLREYNELNGTDYTSIREWKRATRKSDRAERKNANG